MVDVIWDHLFIEGNTALFKTGLFFMEKLEKDLLECEDFGSDFQFGFFIVSFGHFLPSDFLANSPSISSDRGRSQGL